MKDLFFSFIITLSTCILEYPYPFFGGLGTTTQRGLPFPLYSRRVTIFTQEIVTTFNNPLFFTFSTFFFLVDIFFWWFGVKLIKILVRKFKNKM